tara:strand:- start:2747 stop:3496 length:750 start_codon:yes stop_codon:yes gene_type:complete
MKLYIIIAPRRSGHHAVINWLDSILPEKGVIINDTDWQANKPFMIPQINEDRTEYEYWDHEVKPQKTSVEDNSYILYNIEERPLEDIVAHLKGNEEQSFWGKENITIIINQRSFLNFVASKINHTFEKNPYNFINGIKRWNEYTKELLNETSLLENFKYTTILFDKWFSSIDYRKKLCKTFNGKIKNEEINKVSEHGRGSTFDGQDKDGKGQEMKVLERYKLLAPDFLEKFENSSYNSDSKKLFKDANN